MLASIARLMGSGTAHRTHFFDVQVFYPFVSSYQTSSLTSLLREHELKIRLEYSQRVREVEHGGFSPPVFSTTGGAATEANVFMKRLASMIV